MDPVILMSLAQALDFDKVFKITFDVEKLTVDITILNVTIKGIKYSALKALKEDTQSIENIVNDLFLQKGIMWVDFRREEVDACLVSLKDLIDKLKEERSKFEKTGKQSDKALASILNVWSMECDKTVREFAQAKENEVLASSDYYAEPMPAKEEIPRILGTFRANTLKIADTFIQILPENNKIRIEAEERYNRSKDELIKYYNIDSKLIKGLEWAVQVEGTQK